MKITALITAAGSGIRMNQDQPKQFLDLCGKPILTHTLEIFLHHPSIDEVLVVLAPNSNYTYPNVKTVTGGATRADSVYQGIKSIDSNPDLLLIHDGVRCLTQPKLIDQLIEACQAPYDGAVLGLPVRGTLKKTKQDLIETTVNRENLWEVQTPQAFFFKTIAQAYQNQLHIDTTDDAQVMERAGAKIKMIQGQSTNIKITYPEDLILAKQIMEQL